MINLINVEYLEQEVVMGNSHETKEKVQQEQKKHNDMIKRYYDELEEQQKNTAHNTQKETLDLKKDIHLIGDEIDIQKGNGFYTLLNKALNKDTQLEPNKTQDTVRNNNLNKLKGLLNIKPSNVSPLTQISELLTKTLGDNYTLQPGRFSISEDKTNNQTNIIFKFTAKNLSDKGQKIQEKHIIYKGEEYILDPKSY